MGSSSFNHYTSSPTIFLPPQEHRFYPSSHTHCVQYHQATTSVMDPSPLNPGRSEFMCHTSLTTSRPSRKRPRCESFGSDAEMRDTSMPNRSPPGIADYRELDIAMSWDAAKSPAVNGPGLGNSFFDGPPATGLSSSDEPDKVNEHITDAEDRRKFQCQRPGGGSTQDSTDLMHDPIALQLGVGWKSIGDDSDRQAAARGWAKFIEENYQIGVIEILAQCTGDAWVLAKASRGYYIFEEHLRCGVFLARSWGDLVDVILSNAFMESAEEDVICARDFSGTIGRGR